MARADVVEALIATQGELYAEAMGANIARNTPQELFHWLVGAILLSARINASAAVETARGLRSAGLHKIDSLLDVDFWDVVEVLHRGGYGQYQEQATGQIREAAELVRDRYGGDLRVLRDEAADAEGILSALQEVKGIGKVGASVFAREAQLVWDPLFPRLDGPAVDAARDLGLPTEAEALRDLAGDRPRFVRLVAALTRASLDGPSDAVRDAA